MSRSLDQASSSLLLTIPDIICIDWQFETDIQVKIYEILTERMLTANFILIFYNVASQSNIIRNCYFDDHSFFFKKNFTISELNEVLSKVNASTIDKPKLHTDQVTSILEGKITEYTLSEVLQMMDINKKTGCLLVENNHPEGMMFFENGLITYAITNSQVAEQAVFDILSMTHGKFKFLPNKKPTRRQMQLDIVAILMEKAKLSDEIQTLI
jgi:hypothetical protein